MSEQADNEMTDFRNQKVWRKSRFLVLELFTLTKSVKRDDVQSLLHDIRTDCVAITTNIALAHNQCDSSERIRFVQMAFALAIKLQETLARVQSQGLLQDDVYGQINDDVSEVKGLLADSLREMSRT